MILLNLCGSNKMNEMKSINSLLIQHSLMISFIPENSDYKYAIILSVNNILNRVKLDCIDKLETRRVASVREIVKRRDVYLQGASANRTRVVRSGSRERERSLLRSRSPGSSGSPGNLCPQPARRADAISFVRKQRECEKAECRAAEQVPRFPGQIGGGGVGRGGAQLRAT